MCICVCVSFRRYTRRRLWSDRDQIWHTHADSSPNGSKLNKNQLRVTQGGTWVFLRDQKLTNVGKLPNRWIDRHQFVHTYADLFRNEHRLKRNYPLETPGRHLGVDVVKNASI